ncbi:hypothetical protein KY307_01505 [Candidatus Woesearchaeota archaeon]|nr:hypothetical protein [Candidatus Woesearchaeota archaeon]
MGVLRKILLVAALVGVTAYATYKYRHWIGREVEPRVEYVVNSVKKTFEKNFSEYYRRIKNE